MTFLRDTLSRSPLRAESGSGVGPERRCRRLRHLAPGRKPFQTPGLSVERERRTLATEVLKSPSSETAVLPLPALDRPASVRFSAGSRKNFASGSVLLSGDAGCRPPGDGSPYVSRSSLTSDSSPLAARGLWRGGLESCRRLVRQSFPLGADHVTSKLFCAVSTAYGHAPGRPGARSGLLLGLCPVHARRRGRHWRGRNYWGRAE